MKSGEKNLIHTDSSSPINSSPKQTSGYFGKTRGKFKTVLVKLLIGALKGLNELQTKSPRLAKILLKPLGTIGRFFLLLIILPIYKLYLATKKFTHKFYAPQKSKHRVIHPFSRRYLAHVIIVAISIFTIGSNLNAYETRREDFGQGSVIASLITTEDLGIIEEEGPITTGAKITRYLGQTGVESQPQASEGGEGEEILPTTVTGGSALVQPILSPIEEDLRVRDKIVYYTIQPGDTISEVAERFGITTNTILWENNLSAYSLIRPGDTLTILPTAGIQHKVASGDTVAKIASKYGIDADKIIEYNKLTSADDIKTGERIMIPGGKKEVVQPTYSFRSLAVSAPAVIAPKVVATGKMLWPTTCHRITQYFRWLHSGVDIACSFGEAVYAADDGTVVTSQDGWNGGYGNYIIIDHGNGQQSLYGHLSQRYVAVGETISKGQTIAAMGSTGRSSGPHVHFEVRTGGARQNPLYYIQ